MTVKVGDKVPSAKLKQMSAEGPKDVSTDELNRIVSLPRTPPIEQ